MNNYKADLMEDLKDLGYSSKYLSAALADSPESFLVALRDVAEVHQGMSKVASTANLNRENLYRMLSKKGNPRLENLWSVLNAIGLRLLIEPAKKTRKNSNAQSTDRHLVSR
jgi:probable addiction module antidote protein